MRPHEKRPWTKTDTVLLTAVLVLAGIAGAMAAYVVGQEMKTPGQQSAHVTTEQNQIAPASGYTGADCTTSTSCTVSLTANAYSVVLVGFTNYADTAPSAVAIHGLTEVSLEVESASSHPYVGLYGFIYSTSSSATVKVYANTTASSYVDVEVADIQYTSMNTTYYSGVGANDGNSGSASASCTPGVSGELIFAVMGVLASESTITAGSGQTKLTTETTTTDVATSADSDYYDTATTSYSMTDTLGTSGDWAMVCAGIEGTVVPNIPTSLAAGSATTTTIPLTWSAANSKQATYLTAAQVYYAVYSSGACGAYSSGVAASSPYTSATQTSLIEGDYYCFYVTVSNTTGASSDSAVLSDVATQFAPIAPTGVTVAGQSGSTSELNVHWTQNPGNPTAYSNATLFYTTSSSCGATKTYVNDADSSSTFWQITGLSAGATEYIEVAEWNSIGIGTWSACTSGTTWTTPTAPTNLGTSGQTSTSVTLTWTQPSGITVANVTISYGTPQTTPSPYCTSLTQVSAGAVSTFTVTGLPPSTGLCFAVAAWSTGGLEGLFSAYLNVTTLTPVPGAATGLTSSAVSRSGFTLTWTNPTLSTGTIVNVTVDVGTVCGTWSQKNSVGGNYHTYSVSSLSADMTYCTAVGVWDQGGEGPLAFTNVTTNNALMNAPTLSELSASRTTITLSWTYSYNSGSYPVVNATVFYLQATSCTGTFTPVSTEGNATSWQLVGLIAGDKYCVYVEGFTSGGPSPASNELSLVAQPSTPPAPTALTLTSAGKTWIDFSWVNPTGYTLYNNSVMVGPSGGSCGTGYTVASGWSAVHSLGGIGTAYNVTGLSTGETVCLEVVAWDGPSNLSQPLIVVTLGNGTLGGLGGGNLAGAAIDGLILLLFVGLAIAAVRVVKRK